MITTDVVVIGAGPAGSTVGEQISSAGFNVLFLEKTRFPGKNKICGGAIPKSCSEDLNLPSNIIQKECSKWIVHFPGEKLEAPKKSVFDLFERENLDQLLAQRAVEKGAKLLTSTLVTDVVRLDKGMAVFYKELPGGELKETRGRLVVFADGTSTLGYKKFQVGFSCNPDGTALAAAYDLKYPNNSMDSLNFHFSEEISPFGYGWIFPKKDSVNLGVLCLLSKMKLNIRSYLDHFVSEAKLGTRDVIRFGSRLMPQSYVEKIYADSLLIVGDAAGTVDPIDGGGIFNAVVSGEIAGKVAIEALEAEDTSSNFLAKYAALWKKTENFRFFRRSCFLQRLALKSGLNLGFFLKKLKFFDQFIPVDEI